MEATMPPDLRQHSSTGASLKAAPSRPSYQQRRRRVVCFTSYTCVLHVVLTWIALSYLLLVSVTWGQFRGTLEDEASASGEALAPGYAQERKIQNRRHPLVGMVRSAVPSEMKKLRSTVRKLLGSPMYRNFDCVHVSVPDLPMRENSRDGEVGSYPSTKELQETFANQPRVILHRLFDYGPMTRYIGPLAYEQNPDTSIVIFDMDSTAQVLASERNMSFLVEAAQEVDSRAMWCYQAENFLYHEQTGRVVPNWDLFPMVQEPNNGTKWNHAHFCRATGGLLFKPKHFDNFFWNQTEYHESCFWDDDRWVSYQMERQGIPIKKLHPPTENKQTEESRGSNETVKSENRTAPTKSELDPQRPPLEAYPNASSLLSNVSSFHVVDNRDASVQRRRLGTLTRVTKRLRSDVTCPVAWLQHHPEAYPSARVEVLSSPPPKRKSLRNRRERRNGIHVRVGLDVANNLNRTRSNRRSHVALKATT